MFVELDQDELISIAQRGVGPASIRTMSYEEAGAELSSQLDKSVRYLGFVDSLWDRLKAEFHELVCKDGGKYADLQARFAAMGDQGTAAIVAAVSAGMAATIGVAAVVISPVVALLLLAFVRLGRQAFCSVRHLDDQVAE